mgnify:CR=1 FL=1
MTKENLSRGQIVLYRNKGNFEWWIVDEYDPDYDWYSIINGPDYKWPVMELQLTPVVYNRDDFKWIDYNEWVAWQKFRGR